MSGGTCWRGTLGTIDVDVPVVSFHLLPQEVLTRLANNEHTFSFSSRLEQNVESVLDGKYFYDFGFGNETDYYNVANASGTMVASSVKYLWDPGMVDASPAEHSSALDEQEPPQESFITSTWEGHDANAGLAKAGVGVGESLHDYVVFDEADVSYLNTYSEDVFAARVKRVRRRPQIARPTGTMCGSFGGW